MPAMKIGRLLEVAHTLGVWLSIRTRRAREAHPLASAARRLRDPGRDAESVAGLQLGAVDRLVCRLASWTFRLLGLTYRYRVEGQERALELLKAGRPVLLASCHARILNGVYCLRRMRPIVMVSRSRAGGRMSQTLERLGWRTVRGSSSRGGAVALRDMIRALGPGDVGVHIVDGPRGPAGVVKPGLVLLAKRTAAALVPVYATASHRLEAKSWDRMQIPLPFARIYLRYDEPLEVPADLTLEKAEVLRRDLEERFAREYARLDGDARRGSGKAARSEWNSRRRSSSS